MFVKNNSYSAVQHYFRTQLHEKFSEREIRHITNAFIRKRLNLTDADLLLSKGLQFSESDLLFFRAMVKRLLENEPFQYLIGKVFFHSIELKVTPQALIPRPETEELVEWILADLTNKTAAQRVLDIGTGSGCIPLAIKYNRPQDAVFACDFSIDALVLAKENSSLTKLPVSFFQTDIVNWENGSAELFQTWDVIVSNPPYIPQRDRAEMALNVLEFEPLMALFVADEDPLLFYHSIGEFAFRHLAKTGCVYFEIHEAYADEVKECLSQIGFTKLELREDLQQKNRMIKASF